MAKELKLPYEELVAITAKRGAEILIGDYNNYLHNNRQSNYSPMLFKVFAKHTLDNGARSVRQAIADTIPTYGLKFSTYGIGPKSIATSIMHACKNVGLAIEHGDGNLLRIAHACLRGDVELEMLRGFELERTIPLWRYYKFYY